MAKPRAIRRGVLNVRMRSKATNGLTELLGFYWQTTLSFLFPRSNQADAANFCSCAYERATAFYNHALDVALLIT